MKKHYHHQKGSVSVELAMGFFGFWLMMMAWVEMSYLSYVNAITDLAIAEIGHSSKRENTDYHEAVLSRMTSENALWRFLVDEDKFTLSIRYYTNIGDFLDFDGKECIKDEGTEINLCGEPEDRAIAVYGLSYEFKSIFSYFITKGLDIHREVMVVQEYERDQFNY